MTEGIGEKEMSSKSIESLIDYLNNNNRKKLKAFVDGKIDIQYILHETGAKREEFYRAIHKMGNDNTIIKSRKYNVLLKRKIISEEIFDMIKENIPYEYMGIDEVRLFGKSSKYLKEKDASIKKARITNILRENGIIISDSDYKFMNYRLMETMYRKIMVIEAYKLGKTGFSIAKLFNTYPSIVYKILDSYNKTGRYIDNVSSLQEDVFVRNIKVFNKYKDGCSIKELADEYKIKLEFLEKNVKVLLNIEKNIINVKE